VPFQKHQIITRNVAAIVIAKERKKENPGRISKKEKKRMKKKHQ
jgi:hypothetical protein